MAQAPRNAVKEACDFRINDVMAGIGHAATLVCAISHPYQFMTRLPDGNALFHGCPECTWIAWQIEKNYDAYVSEDKLGQQSS